MSRRQLKSDDVEGFMQACWDELSDLRQQYGLAILLDIRPKVNRGGFSLHASATRIDEEGNQRLACAARVDWPTDKAVSLHTLFYRLVLALDHGVQEEYHQRTGQWYGSPRVEPAEKP
jgi:hypothetical protein